MAASLTERIEHAQFYGVEKRNQHCGHFHVARSSQARRNNDKITPRMKPLARYIEEAGMSVGQLVAATGLDSELIKAVVSGNYTPSPLQRERLAAALGASKDDISWDHSVPVEHLRGNGPQCGRST